MEEVPAIRRSILRQIALLTNKFLLAKDIHRATDILWRPSTGLLNEKNLSQNSLRAVFWIAKALILRLANTDEVLERLMGLLPHITYGSVAARGFGLLLAPDEIISKENGVTIRLLAKQKVFNICVPAIAKAFRNADASVKSNYLVALSGILKCVPTEVLMPEIDTILPLLLQCLDLKDSEVKAATIETLAVVSQESPKAVEGHISSLVNRLLKSAADPKTNTTVCLVPSLERNSLILKHRESATTLFDAFGYSLGRSRIASCFLIEEL